MWGKLASSMSGSFVLNQATLSGCIDIIVVGSSLRERKLNNQTGKDTTKEERDTNRSPKIKSESEVLRCTPFHVRFGKFKLLFPKDREVSIYINGHETSLKMKLGEAGEAYFEETDKNTSPSAKSKLIETDLKIYHRKASTINIDLPIGNDETFAGNAQDINIKFSLCANLLYGGENNIVHDHDVFAANVITYDQLNSHPSLWYSPDLVCRIDKYPVFIPGKIALPLITSWALSNQPLSDSAILDLVKFGLKQNNLTDKDFLAMNCANNTLHVTFGCNKVEDMLNLCGYKCDDMFYRKLRPTSQQLKSLGLKNGVNRITFSIFSSICNKRKNVEGSIYLWNLDDKIVVTDIDGTLTRSDLLGQIMPMVGGDCAQKGVARLFSKIRNQGYKILYLTARAIGQADSTRDFLFSLKQNYSTTHNTLQHVGLPDGPLIMSPDRLFSSLKREVIDRKPYILKISALREIRNLFPTYHNPFFAGFGNRDTDHKSYVHAGIPKSKIFIVNSNGIISRIHNSAEIKTTYLALYNDVEKLFPIKNGYDDIEGITESEDITKERKIFKHTLFIDDESEVMTTLFCGVCCTKIVGRGIPIIL